MTMYKSCAKKSQQKKKKTSTPIKLLSNLSVEQDLNVSNISAIRNNSSSASNKERQNKEGTVGQHDLDVAHNIYLLALATNTLQIEAISNITTEQENQKLAQLSEMEKRRSHLASLKKRVEEVTNLTQRSHLLSSHKEKLRPIMDQVVSSLQNMKILTNAFDRDLPISEFSAEINASDIKNVLYETKKTLGRKYSVTSDNESLYSKAAQEVTDLQNMIKEVTEIQKSCDSTSLALSSVVIKESSLKGLESRSKNEDVSCPEHNVAMKSTGSS